MNWKQKELLHQKEFEDSLHKLIDRVSDFDKKFPLYVRLKGLVDYTLALQKLVKEKDKTIAQLEEERLNLFFPKR